MFDRTSRYFNAKTKTLDVVDDEGRTREVRYAERRFIPPDSNSLSMQEHTVLDGERPDSLAARYLGDPTRFWQMCDANNVMHPDELTEDVGVAVRVPMPRP